MVALLRALVALITTALSSVWLRELAVKYFFRGLFLVAVPVAILGGFNLILDFMVNYIVSALANQNPGNLSVVNLGGLGIYLCQELGLTDVMYMLCSAYGVKLVMRSIPFTRL